MVPQGSCFSYFVLYANSVSCGTDICQVYTNLFYINTYSVVIKFVYACASIHMAFIIFYSALNHNVVSFGVGEININRMVIHTRILSYSYIVNPFGGGEAWHILFLICYSRSRVRPL